MLASAMSLPPPGSTIPQFVKESKLESAVPQAKSSSFSFL
jgi:hypothetical protein